MSCCGTPPSPEELDEVGKLITQKLSGFIRTLRDAAFTVGLREGEDAARLIASGYARSPDLLRQALKHLLSSRKEEWDRFDGIFGAYWQGKRARSKIVTAGTSSGSANSLVKPAIERSDMSAEGAVPDQASGSLDEDGTHERTGEGRAEGASRADVLASTDFRKLNDPAEIAEAHDVAARLAQAMRTRLTRRDLARRRGYRLDLRRTIHRNISHGGVPISLVKRQRKHKPLRLVILLDVSGSMSMYTGTFLRFIHGVLDEFREAEAFLFHTQLAHVSDAMKERDPARALDRLSLMAQGAGGGTRIGESLATFNRWHASRVIHSRTCVMIVCDGYETGDAQLLGREMTQLARRCKRIVWLNPMLGWDGYSPDAAGIKAALPHVDLFAPANTLKSLADLEPYLARL